MIIKVTINISLLLVLVSANDVILKNEQDYYSGELFHLLRNVIDYGTDSKGWINFLSVGNWPDTFFQSIHGLPYTFLVANDSFNGNPIDEILRYPLRALVVDCEDFDDFENNMNIVYNSPYWHPHTKTIVFYHNYAESNETIAKMFFSLWYNKVINAIIVQRDDASRYWITYFNQFITKDFRLDHSYGCWTRKKLVNPVISLKEDLVCTRGCQNVTLYSKLRVENLGTCMGFTRIPIPSVENLKVNFFMDKAKNMHGFQFRAYTTEIMPFLMIDEDNGTYTMRERDGILWNTMADIMNFTFDLSLNAKNIKKNFDFQLSIKHIFDFARRKGDLLIMPVYQFDFVVVDVDLTVPFKESGLCVLAHRASYETALFDIKMLKSNYTLLIKFIFCFIGIWFVFTIFNMYEKGVVSWDQTGKDFVNVVRNILSICLHKPPKKGSFKIFLLFSIWSFFVLNFSTQAAIISFFSAFKRGKEVETFEDIIEKGYPVEGVASPDTLLPDTRDIYRAFNSRIVPIQDLFGCVKFMYNDSRRFCLIDCSVGRYLKRNRLNEKGEQYLHIAKDQIHKNYLTMILQRHSVLTDEYNRYMLRFLQAGLINKWEQYRFSDIKYEAPVKSLDMNDLIGIFKCYITLIIISIVTFILEVSVGRIRRRCQNFYRKKQKN